MTTQYQSCEDFFQKLRTTQKLQLDQYLDSNISDEEQGEENVTESDNEKEKFTMVSQSELISQRGSMTEPDDYSSQKFSFAATKYKQLPEIEENLMTEANQVDI